MQILSLPASIPLPRVGGYWGLGRGTTTQDLCAECFQVAYPATLRGQASQTQSSAQGCRAGISCNLSGSVLGAWSHFLEQRGEEKYFSQIPRRVIFGFRHTKYENDTPLASMEAFPST